jgi:hypothetical protein
MIFTYVSCFESWKCFRGQRLDSHFSTEPVQQVSTQNTKPTDWLADADDWGEASNIDDDNGNVRDVSEHFQEQFHKMSIQHQVSRYFHKTSISKL